MATSNMASLKETFAELDRDFADVKHTTDDKYVYNATDVLVQTTWELPIVIQYPESTVNFEFCSNPGDISFGIIFVASPEEGQDINDLEIETVQEMDIVRSNLESVSGSFEVPCEGVLFFMWDNNFDWSATKQISYLIEVSQPAFRYADLLRVDKCLPLLNETIEDLNAAYVRNADAQDCIEHNTANVSFLEEQLQTLERKRRIKAAEKSKLDDEIEKLEQKVELGIVITPGLCVRGMEKSILTHMLSFLNSSGAINYVCKYWSELAADIRDHEAAVRLKTLAQPARSIKRTKSEIKTSLAQIKVGIMLRELSARQAEQSRADAESLQASRASQDVDPSAEGINLSTHGSVRAGSTFNGTITPAMSVGSIAGQPNSTTAPASSAAGSNVAVQPDNRSNSASPVRPSADRAAAVASGKKGQGGTSPEDVELSATSESEDSLQVSAASPEVTTRKKLDTAPSTGAAVGQRGDAKSNNVRVSFDNVLPGAQNLVHTESFIKKTSPELSSPPMKTKRSKEKALHSPAAAIATKTRPQPEQDAADFARNLQWGRQRPIEGMRAAPLPEPVVLRNDSPTKRSKKEKSVPSPPPPPPAPGVAESPKLPAVAESKRKPRVKVTTAPTGATPAAVPTAPAPSPAVATGSKKSPKHASGLPDSENSRNLLLHVKKVRSDQQMSHMIDYLQAGFIKIETLTTEKRRIKKLIKAWNASFEKKNSRLPTSSERKGHLRELYEEYHQVALALRIRAEKMEDSLRTVGLTMEEYEALRDKKNNDW